MSALAESFKGPRPPEPASHEDVARRAIGYLLARIADDPEVAWHFIATESYARLVDAYAVLTGKTAAEVEGTFKIRGSRCCWRCEEIEREGRAA